MAAVSGRFGCGVQADRARALGLTASPKPRPLRCSPPDLLMAGSFGVLGRSRVQQASKWHLMQSNSGFWFGQGDYWVSVVSAPAELDCEG